MNERALNRELLEACTARDIDLSRIEQLLKTGAAPLGRVDIGGNADNLYNVVLYHFLDHEGDEDSVLTFFRITEAFLRYGMDISRPEIAYDNEDVLNPLWGLAFFRSATARQIFKLFLDHGLDADQAGMCWGHKWSDLSIARFSVDDDVSSELAADCFRTVMLTASYPHILEKDDELKRVIWFDENSCDIAAFRDPEKFDYIPEPAADRDLLGSLIHIREKDTKKEIWRFGFELSPEEYGE